MMLTTYLSLLTGSSRSRQRAGCEGWEGLPGKRCQSQAMCLHTQFADEVFVHIGVYFAFTNCNSVIRVVQDFLELKALWGQQDQRAARETRYSSCQLNHCSVMIDPQICYQKTPFHFLGWHFWRVPRASWQARRSWRQGASHSVS